jgi:monofunctional chorismate mutase
VREFTVRRMLMFSIRGATTVERDTKDEINVYTEELILKTIEANNIVIEDIVSILFTCTRDLKSAYPAEAARKIGIRHAGLMCMQEMYVEGSMEKCIRVLIMVNGEREQANVKHVYLKNAAKLRPDLLQDFKEIY